VAFESGGGSSSRYLKSEDRRGLLADTFGCTTSAKTPNASTRDRLLIMDSEHAFDSLCRNREHFEHRGWLCWECVGSFSALFKKRERLEEHYASTDPIDIAESHPGNCFV
jgi:hypothetical protein